MAAVAGGVRQCSVASANGTHSRLPSSVGCKAYTTYTVKKAPTPCEWWQYGQFMRMHGRIWCTSTGCSEHAAKRTAAALTMARNFRYSRLPYTGSMTLESANSAVTLSIICTRHRFISTPNSFPAVGLDKNQTTAMRDAP
jgi:hypothetical protein